MSGMGRREFVALLGGAAAWPLGAGAQQGKLVRLGYLDSSSGRLTSDSVGANLRRQFLLGLRDLGRALAVGTVADDGVGAFDRNVGERQAVDVDAHGRKVTRDQARAKPSRARSGRGVAVEQAAVDRAGWIRRPMRRSHALHPAALLIDQEGGRVQRMGPPHWPAYPPGAVYGRLFDRNAAAGTRAAWLGARLIASDLAAVGVDVDCLPLADVPVEGADAIIGNRAYGKSAPKVAQPKQELAAQVGPDRI